MPTITRIDYASQNGLRSAVVTRTVNDHVPPLGVTWYCIPAHDRGTGPGIEFTSRAAAERHARAWCAQEDTPR